MQKIPNSNSANHFNDEIDIRDLFNNLLEGKWIIISFTAFMSIITVIYSLYLPNMYESKAMLAPINSSNSNSGALGSLGGIAELAGINLPAGGGSKGHSAKAIKKIISLSFFENNILANIHLPDLMAISDWDPKTNTIVYDESIYDISSNSWIRDFTYPQKQIPSAQESFKVFMEHVNLDQDKTTGFITLTIKHQSPYVAKEWVELAVNEVNNFYRQKDRLESEAAISFLNQQISMTSFSEIKEVLAQLLQEEIKKLTLVEANKFYVFDYIDPPEVMERKSEPNRALTCLLGAIFGGMLGICFVLIRRYASVKT